MQRGTGVRPIDGKLAELGENALYAVVRELVEPVAQVLVHPPLWLLVDVAACQRGEIVLETHHNE